MRENLFHLEVGVKTPPPSPANAAAALDDAAVGYVRCERGWDASRQ